ncbi:uncharacterized protein LOC143611066 [Bidens hawaiensis]|uniref:uncharacterized protein LOC143611066 n=1 Tax=Bidens hawaiensis TaxID=980011 RepID=UPI004049D17C
MDMAGSEDGMFSVSAAKKLIIDSRQYDPFLKFKWDGWMPIKCNVLAWRAEQDRIPTKIALNKRGMGLSEDSCPFCELHQESANHIFIGCIFAAEIWDRIAVWCRLDPIFVFEVRDILVLAKCLKKPKLNKRVAHCIVVTALWSMWNARNEMIFQDKEAKAYEVVSKIKSCSYFWIQNRSRFKSIEWSDWCKYPFGLM